MEKKCVQDTVQKNMLAEEVLRCERKPCANGQAINKETPQDISEIFKAVPVITVPSETWNYIFVSNVF